MTENESMFRRKRVPIYKPAECLGESCAYFQEEDCNARLELLDASGKSGGVDKGPRVNDCNYALYGRVCMGGDEQVVVGLEATSPNGQASAAEIIARAGLLEGQRIVLNTPPEEVKF